MMRTTDRWGVLAAAQQLRCGLGGHGHNAGTDAQAEIAQLRAQLAALTG